MSAVDPSSLPAPVRRYVERALPDGAGAASARRVRITQRGEMILKPGARPRAFTATEELEVERVAFGWWATFPMLGPLGLRVTDRYEAGDGLLEARLLGVPLQRQRGPVLAQGEAFRYLAEIAWVPHAILANAELEWTEVGERAVEVATSVSGERVAVQLRFDQAGELTQTYAERPRLEADNAITPWIGEYGDYRTFGEILVPAGGEVRWELPGGPFTYWRAAVTSLVVVT